MDGSRPRDHGVFPNIVLSSDLQLEERCNEVGIMDARLLIERRIAISEAAPIVEAQVKVAAPLQVML